MLTTENDNDQGSDEHERSYAALWQKYSEPLLGYLTRMLGCAVLAQSVAHAACEKVHRPSKTQELPYPRAILFREATNLAVMEIRRRRMELDGKAPTVVMESRDKEAPHQAPDLDDLALAAQFGDQVGAVIARLPLKLRKAFVLVAVEGVPRPEVARQLAISSTRLERRLTNALKKCRRQISAL